MAEDVIAWGKIDDVATKMDGVNAKMDTLVTDVTEAVQSAPSGIMAPRMMWLASESVSNGIKLTYKANVGVSFDGRIPSKEDEYNYDLASVTKGVMVRYKTGSYPLNKNDGTLAFTDDAMFTTNDKGELVPREKSHTVTGLSSNTKYYFTAFPYSTYGAYNEQLGTSNCTTCTYSSNKGAVRVHVGLSGYHNKPLGDYKVTLTGGGGTFTQQGSGENDFIFNSLSSGSYTLKLSGVKDFVVPADQTVNIVAGQTKTARVDCNQMFTLETCTWEDVENIAASGQAANIFSIGEGKTVRVDNEDITFEIADFNHDDLTNGGKAPITFAMKNLMANKRRMNPTDTNVGGFVGSEMYTWLQNDLFNSLPSDLQGVIKTVKKKTSSGNKSSVITTDSMKLFLFSEKETVGTAKGSFDGEGYQYPGFAKTDRLIKKMENGAGSANYWSLRSPRKDHVACFCNITSEGMITSSFSAENPSGVCFGFCI